MSEIGVATQSLPGLNVPSPAEDGLVAVVNLTEDNWAYVDVTDLASTQEIVVVFVPFVGSNTLRAQGSESLLEIFPGHTQTVEIEERFLTRESNLNVGTYGGIIEDTTGAVTELLHDDSDLLTKMRFEDTDGTQCVYTLGLVNFTSRMVKTNSLVSLEFVVRIPPNANSTITIGLGLNGGSQVHHFIHSNPGSGGTYQNWYVRNDDGLVDTIEDTGVLATDQPVNLQIVKTASGLDFFIDGVLVESVSFVIETRTPLIMTVEQLAGTPSEASEFEASLIRLRCELDGDFQCLPNDVEILQ